MKEKREGENLNFSQDAKKGKNLKL